MTRLKEAPLKGWRKLGRMTMRPPVIRTPEGDFILPPNRGRSAVVSHVVRVLWVVTRPIRQASGVAATYFRQTGKEVRLLLFGVVTALRKGLVVSRDVLAVARTSILAVGELWRSQGRTVRLFAAQLARSDRTLGLVTSVALCALTVALLLVALLGEK